MSLRQAIIGQAVVAAVVAKVIEKARAHASRFEVGVDVAQCVEGSLVIVGEKSFGVVAFLPKVPSAAPMVTGVTALLLSLQLVRGLAPLTRTRCGD